MQGEPPELLLVNLQSELSELSLQPRERHLVRVLPPLLLQAGQVLLGGPRLVELPSNQAGQQSVLTEVCLLVVYRVGEDEKEDNASEEAEPGQGSVVGSHLHSSVYVSAYCWFDCRVHESRCAVLTRFASLLRLAEFGSVSIPILHWQTRQGQAPHQHPTHL